ncbi:MAG: thioredoxin domain-containing protein [Gammaproteobacteria bacterium]|nr:thioredoxin domain-containing protein [Gammaproteobacteria bacterium]
MKAIAGRRWVAVISMALLCATAALPGAATEERALFALGGKNFSESELTAAQRQRVFDAYVAYRQAIELVVRDAVFDLQVQKVMRESGKSEAEARAGLLPSEKIADEQVEQFYQQNQARIRMPLAQVRGQIADYLTSRRDDEVKQTMASALRRSGELTDKLPPALAPRLAIETAGFASKGAADAAVTIVEFADFQCPHCQSASPVVDQVMKAHAGKVRVVYIDFPINPSGISRLVSRGGACALEQDKFWPYHDLAFERQRSLTEESPRALADDVGLDLAAFDACFAAARSADFVAKGEAQANSLGVNSTPTLYVNGRRLQLKTGMAPDLEAAVQAALNDPSA